VTGQFHVVGDLAEGRLDAVAPFGDDFQQDGGHGGALLLVGRDEDGGAAGGLGGGEGPAVEALLARAQELDAENRAATDRLISQDALRNQMRIGRDRADAIVAVVRAEMAAAEVKARQLRTA
jgi:hypothetical protein